MADRWELDPNHTVFGFSAKHMMFTTVRGRFDGFEGWVDIEGDDYRTARGEVVIKTASVDSGVADRDAHLKSPDFFDVERYPEMRFVSTGVKRIDDSHYTVTGDLRIKNVTRPVTVQAEVGQKINDPWGNERVALSAAGKINRKDWGLNWNMALEAGGFLVSDSINLEIETAFVHKLPVAAGEPVGAAQTAK